MNLQQKLVYELSAIEIIVYAVVSVIIAQLWLRASTNLLFSSLATPTSSWTLLVLSISFTFVFLYYAMSYPATLVGFL